MTHILKMNWAETAKIPRLFLKGMFKLKGYKVYFI